MKPISV